jgi:uncharacterized protein YggE
MAQENIAPHVRGDGARHRTLTVTGNGEAAARPDQATVRLGATAQAENAAAAQTTVNATMQKAIEAIQKTGVERTDIRTSGLTLHPVYAPQKPETATEPRIVAYRASNTIEATVKKMELVGDVVDAGLNAGANRLEGVSFGLQNDLFQRKLALTEAAKEAREKAQTIARALDVQLGDVREVVEGGVSVLPQREYFGGARMMAADAVRTPVEPGEIRVHASVTVHYDLR